MPQDHAFVRPYLGNSLDKARYAISDAVSDTLCLDDGKGCSHSHFKITCLQALACSRQAQTSARRNAPHKTKHMQHKTYAATLQISSSQTCNQHPSGRNTRGAACVLRDFTPVFLYYYLMYYTILYYTILYYTILYYTILYYTILYYYLMV